MPDFQWLYIDFNSYFASVEQQMRPHLRGRPIAVVPVDTNSTCAIAASYEAKAFGVKTGTPIHEARRLCPELICVLASHERYVTFHQRILEEVDRHIPITAVCSIDEMACRLMRNEASLSAVTRIAASIKAGLARNVGAYVRCSIGVAPNRYLAKVATDLHKPDGFTVLLGPDLPGRLLELELRDLPGIGRSMEKRLIKAGITDMQALWALDAERMRGVWGNIWGERMWHLLRGADLPELETTRRSLGHSHVMAPDMRPPDMAVFVARRLVLKAASRLRRMNYYASTMSFTARLENGPRLHDEERCWRAQDSPTFMRMLDLIWARTLRKSRGQRIKQLGVTLHGLIAADELPADLFDTAPAKSPENRAKSESMSRALDKINTRFGRDSVLLGMLPAQGKSFAGTKVAFNRIPDRAEFTE
jgi:DNA polymerase IV